MHVTRRFCVAITALLAVLTAACGVGDPAGAQMGSSAGVAGPIGIDGSSTVAPLTDAVAEEYVKVAPDVEITLNVSGTGRIRAVLR